VLPFDLHVNAAMTSSAVDPPAVIQCAREVRPGGGVCGVAYELQRAFDARGLSVRNFTLRDIGLPDSPVGSNDFYGGKLRLLRDVIAYSILGTFKLWRQGQWAITICHTDALFGKVYVNHGLHRAALDASGKKWLMLLRNPLHVFLYVREWARFRFAVHQHIVCFSKADADLLMRYFPSTAGAISIIPNGVNIERFFRDGGKRAEFRVKNSFSESDFVLCFVGHEFERKGLYPVIEALSALPREVRLVVAGGRGQMLNAAREFAEARGVQNRVTFLGAVQEVEWVMNGCDVLIMPSKFEAWPLVGLEAMACGLPVLLKPTGGISEFLKDGINGYNILDEPGHIAATVQKLLADPQSRRRMSEAAVSTAVQYSWEMIAERYIALLSKDAPASARHRR